MNRTVISMPAQTFLGQPESIPFGNSCSIGIAIVFNILFYLFYYFYFMGIGVLPTNMSVYCGCLVAGEEHVRSRGTGVTAACERP